MLSSTIRKRGIVLKCQECGAENPDEVIACTKCGATLVSAKHSSTFVASVAFVFSFIFGIAAMASGAWIVEDSLGGGLFLVAVGGVVTTTTLIYGLVSEKWNRSENRTKQ